MKTKISLFILLLIFSTLSGIIESYAGEARASASIIIIIPARDEKPKAEEKTVEQGAGKEENLSIPQEAH